MSIALSDLNTLVDGWVRVPPDLSSLGSTSVDAVIKTATAEIARFQPKIVTVDVAGADTYYYKIATVLTSFVDGFSEILIVEYPAATIASDELPTPVDPQEGWELYRTAAGLYLRMIDDLPSSAEKIRVTHTAPYTWSGTPEEVDAEDHMEEPIGLLGAAAMAEVIASYYAKSGAIADFGAGRMDWLSNSAEHRRLAASLRTRGWRTLGVTTDSDGNPVGPSRTVFRMIDTDRRFPAPHGSDYLMHGRRGR